MLTSTTQRLSKQIRALMLSTSFALGVGSCGYMKMNPAPDADKGPPPAPPAVDNSCYLATASNMLAGAGYGNGTTVQDRAEDIYADMVANYGTANGGWTDAALSWWLSSNNNTWTTNPYTVVTVYGNKSPKYPWADANGPRFFGNELRRCQFVGLSISWPTNAANQIGSGGHAITAWGDNSSSGTLSGNPSKVKVTDSDKDAGGDVQTYSYDAYTNPNPGGANEGNGWYFNYDPNHPYIKHIITLCSTDDPSDNKLTQRVLGSYRIHQGSSTAATDLHYVVATDVPILSYRTSVDWMPEGVPSISEANPRSSLTVNWDLSEKPAPDSTWVTITTEFVLGTWNAMWYRDVRFTYPRQTASAAIPDLSWAIESPEIARADTIPNVTGGYVVAAMDVIDPRLPPGEQRIAEYRLIHQYSFNQSPELHELRLTGTEGYAVSNLRIGHSYGYITPDSLWRVGTWMTELAGQQYRLGDQASAIRIDWTGRLPYPEGEDIRGRIRDKNPERGVLRPGQ